MEETPADKTEKNEMKFFKPLTNRIAAISRTPCACGARDA
jgi:hypothetical protein